MENLDNEIHVVSSEKLTTMDEPLYIDKTIKKLEPIFKTTGINIKTTKKTRKDAIKRRLVYIFNSFWFNTDVGGAIVWIFDGIAKHKNFTELTYISPCVCLSLLGNLKSLYLIKHEKTIDMIIGSLRDLEMKERARDKDEAKDKIMNDEHRFVMKIISVLNVFYISLVTAFALSPVTLVALKYFRTKELELVLPFLIIYPFDPYDIRYYPWVYLHQVWSDMLVMSFITSADYLFYTFCTNLRAQFCLIKYNIEKLIPDTKNNQLYNKEDLKAKLSEIIQWHQEVIKCVNLLEKVYTRPILMNFISSSILICLTGFDVMVIDDVAVVITFVSFLFMSLLQIFFLCFFGDLMMTSSTEISDAVYNCRWYMIDMSYRKELLMMQTRSQTPCRLTASGFAEVNLRAFMRILSTAWSYFALLQTMYGSNQ